MVGEESEAKIQVTLTGVDDKLLSAEDVMQQRFHLKRTEI